MHGKNAGNFELNFCYAGAEHYYTNNTAFLLNRFFADVFPPSCIDLKYNQKAQTQLKASISNLKISIHKIINGSFENGCDASSTRYMDGERTFPFFLIRTPHWRESWILLPWTVGLHPESIAPRDAPHVSSGQQCGYETINFLTRNPFWRWFDADFLH